MSVLYEAPQETMFFIPKQNGIDFPLSLAEKYQPRRPEDFVGLARAKNFVANLIAKPRACAALFIGAPGTGKSVMGMALAEALPGSLHHVSAQKCDVSALDALNMKFAYSPPRGAWWICLVDEFDQATEKAQLQLLSRLDGAAALTPTFGGAMVRGVAPPVLWIFTSNGRGQDGLTPPSSLTPRFLSRCMRVEFVPPTASELAAYLEHVWKLEGGGETPEGYFDYVGEGCGVRDALSRLDTDLLAGCREKPEPVAVVHPRPIEFARPGGSVAMKALEDSMIRARQAAAAVVARKMAVSN
jgi:hypothetical protein